MSLLDTLFKSSAPETSACENACDFAREPDYKITENPDSYTVRLLLPGASKESIQISSEEGVLTVTAKPRAISGEEAKVLYSEIESSGFQLRLRHQDKIRVDAIAAEFREGALTLTLPKAENAKARQIPVA